MYTICDSQSNSTISDYVEVGEDEDEDAVDTESGKLNNELITGWLMGTISKVVEQHMENLRQKQMRLGKLMQPRWGDAANYFGEQDMR